MAIINGVTSMIWIAQVVRSQKTARRLELARSLYLNLNPGYKAEIYWLWRIFNTTPFVREALVERFSFICHITQPIWVHTISFLTAIIWNGLAWLRNFRSFFSSVPYSFGVNSDRKVNLRLRLAWKLTAKSFADITYCDHVSNFKKSAALLRKLFLFYFHIFFRYVCVICFPLYLRKKYETLILQTM